MAGIEFSPALGATLPAKLIRLNENTGVNGANTCGLLPIKSGGNMFDACSFTRLRIMKGSVPSDFSGLTTTARSSDYLVLYQTINTALSVSVSDFGLVQATTNPAIISTTYVNATATGTATWFWWQVLGSDGGGGIQGTPLQQIIGTIGLPSSGADLEINDVNIVSGQGYRIRNLRLLFPTQWTY